MKRTTTIEATEPGRVFKRMRSTKVTTTTSKRKSTTKQTSMVKASRHVEANFEYWGTDGWSAGGKDLSFQYTLARLCPVIGGVAATYINLPNMSEFTNLFDQYKIDSIDIEIFYQSNFVNSGMDYTDPILHIVNDYDSSGSFNLADINQYPNVKSYALSPGKKIKWKVKPQFKGDVLTDSGVTSSSVSTQNGWMDTTGTNILGYGTRFYIDSIGNNVNNRIGRVSIRFKYNMSFRYMK